MPNITKNLITNKWNFQSRGNIKVTGVILHTHDGMSTYLKNWFNRQYYDKNGKPTYGVSANYNILLNGDIEQLVEDHNIAYASSVWAVNQTTISIEHEDKDNPADAIRTNQLYYSSAWLIVQLSKKHGFPINDKTIRYHREVYPSKSCPGGLDKYRIIRLCGEIIAKENAPKVNPEVEKLKEQITKLEKTYQTQLKNATDKANKDAQKKVDSITNELKVLQEEYNLLTENSQKTTEKIKELQDKLVEYEQTMDVTIDEEVMPVVIQDAIEYFVQPQTWVERWGNWVDSKFTSRFVKGMLKYNLFVIIGTLLPTAIAYLSPISSNSVIGLVATGALVVSNVFKDYITKNYDTNKDGVIDHKDLQLYS